MSIFHRMNHPILKMASRRRGVYTILFMTGIMCILVILEIATTNKHLWISKLRPRFQLEALPPFACNRCVTEDDDPWFTKRFNASLNPFQTQNNTLSERDFRWWKVNISNIYLPSSGDHFIYVQIIIIQYSMTKTSTNSYNRRERSLIILFSSHQNLQSGNKAFPSYRMAEMKVFEIFPQQESFMDSSPDRCRTCAVVGNSVNLLGSHYGPLIDFHDVIMR